MVSSERETKRKGSMKMAFRIAFLNQATLLLLSFTCVALLYALFITEQITQPILNAGTINNATFH